MSAGPETMRDPRAPAPRLRPWTVLAGEAEPLPRRFNHAVRWEVSIVGRAHAVTMLARSGLKARRTAQRLYPWLEFGEARPCRECGPDPEDEARMS